MDVNQFILIIGSLTTINDLLVQFIKTKITNKHTTLVAFVTAIMLAFLGLYFNFYDFDVVTTIVLGFATGLAGTIGYDKIKECYSSVLLLLNANRNLVFLEESEIEAYDEEKGKLTLDNPENDWSEVETDMVGGEE